MKDSNKLYHLDRNTDSKRNIPFDSNFRLLHVNGLNTSIDHAIGSYEHNGVWVEKSTQKILKPFAWSYLPKFIKEQEEAPEIIPGTRQALDNLTNLQVKD